MADEPQSLAARVRAKYPGMYDDLSDDDLEAKVLAKNPQYADLVKPKIQAPPQEHRMIQGRGTGYDPANAPGNRAAGRQFLGHAAPMIAGLVAAPFTEGMSIPAAMAVMGGTGTAASLGGQALATGEMPSGGQALTDGAIQALTEGTGRTLVKGLQAVLPGAARSIYQSLLKPTDAMVKRFGPAEEIAQGALDAGLPITKTGRAAAIAAEKGAGATRNALTEAVDASGGPQVSPAWAAQTAAAKLAAGDLAKGVTYGADKQAVDEITQQFVADNPTTWSNRMASDKLTSLSDKAKNAMLAARTGERTADMDSKIWNALADDVRQQQRLNVPGVQEANADLQTAMANRRAVSSAEKRFANQNSITNMRNVAGAGLGASGAMVGSAFGDTKHGAEVGGALSLLGMILSHPSLGSKTAIFMNNAEPQNLAQAARALLLAKMAGTDNGGSQ